MPHLRRACTAIAALLALSGCARGDRCASYALHGPDFPGTLTFVAPADLVEVRDRDRAGGGLAAVRLQVPYERFATGHVPVEPWATGATIPITVWPSVLPAETDPARGYERLPEQRLPPANGLIERRFLVGKDVFARLFVPESPDRFPGLGYVECQAAPAANAFCTATANAGTPNVVFDVFVPQSQLAHLDAYVERARAIVDAGFTAGSCARP